MKIDFLGNSHLGTVAPTLTREKSTHEVTHFISRTYGTVFPIVVDNSGGTPLSWITLEEKATGGHVLDLRQTDVLVIMGLRFSLVQMVDLWRHFHPVEAEGSYASPALSQKLWDAYVDAVFDASDMAQTLRVLPTEHRARVVVVPQPAPAAWVAEDPDPRYRLYKRMVRTGDWERVRADFDRQVSRFTARGAQVFPQPDSTVTGRGFTRSDLAMGNPQDNSENSFYSRGDFYHMNRNYAKLWVQEFYAWIDHITEAE